MPVWPAKVAIAWIFRPGPDAFARDVAEAVANRGLRWGGVTKRQGKPLASSSAYITG